VIRRLDSESKQPGMASTRRCISCGEPLPADGSERCSACLPTLSEEARAIGEARRRELEEFANLERQLDNVSNLIRKIQRRLT